GACCCLGHDYEFRLLVDLLARLDRDADLAAVVEDLEAHPRRIARLRVREHHVGEVDGGLALHDSTLGVLFAGLDVLGDDVHPLHDDPIALEYDSQHLAAATLVLSGDDDDLVARTNPLHHSTSGASEMILR